MVEIEFIHVPIPIQALLTQRAAVLPAEHVPSMSLTVRLGQLRSICNLCQQRCHASVVTLRLESFAQQRVILLGIHATTFRQAEPRGPLHTAVLCVCSAQSTDLILLAFIRA